MTLIRHRRVPGVGTSDFRPDQDTYREELAKLRRWRPNLLKFVAHGPVVNPRPSGRRSGPPATVRPPTRRRLNGRRWTRPLRSTNRRETPHPPVGSSPESVAAVRRLLARLDGLAETFGVAALDDPTLAGLAAAVSGAADLAGRWLVGRAAVVTRFKTDKVSDAATGPGARRPPASVVVPVLHPSPTPPVGVVARWGDLFGGVS